MAVLDQGMLSDRDEKEGGGAGGSCKTVQQLKPLTETIRSSYLRLAVGSRMNTGWGQWDDAVVMPGHRRMYDLSIQQDSAGFHMQVKEDEEMLSLKEDKDMTVDDPKDNGEKGAKFRYNGEIKHENDMQDVDTASKEETRANPWAEDGTDSVHAFVRSPDGSYAPSL